MRITMAAGVLALTIFFFPAAGCAPLMPPVEQFDRSFRDFQQRLRWQDSPGAAAYLCEEWRDEFLEHFVELKDLHITDVRSESVKMGEDANTATTRIVLEYYLLPSVAVKTRTLQPEWEYRPGDRSHAGHWCIVEPLAPFP